MRRMLLAAALLAGLPTAAPVTDTITNRYGAHGRPVQVARTVNNGVTTTYGQGKVDIRVWKITTGSPNSPPP